MIKRVSMDPVPPLASSPAAMTPPRRSTWYTRQQQRRASPFYRLLDRSFGFRLLIAAAASFSLLAVVHRFENCYGSDAKTACITSNFWDIVSVGNVESFSIVAAALIYIMEAGQRKEKEHHEMLDLLLTQRDAGTSMSLARIRALEDLSAAGLWQDNFDLHGANLEGLRIPFSRWHGADFSGAVLRQANLRQSDLSGADFHGADLSGADLRGADLSDADFTGADLSGADLSGAQLRGTQFEGANLNGIRSDRSLLPS